MSIRKITVFLRGNPNDRKVLNAGMQIATLFGAHIDAVHLSLGPAELEIFRNNFYPDFPHDMEFRYLQTCTDLAKKSRQRFEDWREALGLTDWCGPPYPGRATASWREDSRSADEAVSQIGRFSDLVITQRPDGRLSALSRFILEGLLFGSGRPTLLMPPLSEGLSVRSAVIAWNGSAEAIHAVTAAVPLLTGAERVTVLVAADPLDPKPEADQLVEYLAWHGIMAELRHATSHKPIGALLLEEATKLQADLLVMGAYTHNPTREQILGGATIHILKHAEIPVLMAH